MTLHLKNFCIALALAVTSTAAAADVDYRWGDLGDGTFANPVLNGDFSDPDVIRVGNKYYLTCSEFHYMGMPILESDDMVNWRVVARVHDSLPLDDYASMQKYGEGTWAPALRYHDGLFYIYVCSPNDGLWVTTAEHAEGPWSPMKLIRAVSGWEDPCPFWDAEGNSYLGRSQLGGGPIYIHRMSADGMRLLDNGRQVYSGPTAEGTKLFAKDGYIYLSIPEGGVGTGWQKVLRATDIYGPYEGVTCLEQGSTDINGPHQGALVDTPEGEWWFYHFQSTPNRGRVVHLQPVEWVDGFPRIGKDYDGNGIGEPMRIVTKPSTGVDNKPFAPQSSDEFTDSEIACFWQFNHNPDMSRYSLGERPGWLRWRPLQAANVKRSRNQLTQKIMGHNGVAETCMDVTGMANLQRAGICSTGGTAFGGGIQVVNGALRPYVEEGGAATRFEAITAEKVWIRLEMNAAPGNETVAQYYISTDGVDFSPFGSRIRLREGDWKGPRVGLYNFNSSSEEGYVDFDYFHYDYDGPGTLGKTPDAVERVETERPDYKVVKSDTCVVIAGPDNHRVSVYSEDGRKVVQSVTNTPLPLSRRGLYIAVTPYDSFKFIY